MNKRRWPFPAVSDDAGWDALVDRHQKQYEQVAQAIQQTITTIEQHLQQLAAAQPERRAVAIKRELEALADQFRRNGEREPRTLAWKNLAGRYGHTSGPALKKWVTRNLGQKMSR